MIYPGIPIIIVAYVPIYGDDWGMVHYIVSHIYIYIYIYTVYPLYYYYCYHYCCCLTHSILPSFRQIIHLNKIFHCKPWLFLASPMAVWMLILRTGGSREQRRPCQIVHAPRLKGVRLVALKIRGFKVVQQAKILNSLYKRFNYIQNSTINIRFSGKLATHLNWNFDSRHNT